MVNFFVTNLSVCRVAARTLFGTLMIKSQHTDCFSEVSKHCFVSRPHLARPGSGYCFICWSRPWGPSHCSKPDRGRAPWACHIYYKTIDIFDFFTISSHNFFPERDTDSDIYIHHFYKSVPRIIISPQISFWTAHRWHSPP